MTESEIANLKAFARAVIKHAWDGSIDGGDVQDLAETHCLIRGEIYDVTKHGEHEDAVPGEDTIYVLSDWMKDR